MNSLFREQATTRLRPDDLLTKVGGGESQTIAAEFWEVSSGGTAYTLIASVTTFNLSAKTATLTLGRILVTAKTNLTISAQSAILSGGKTLLAAKTNLTFSSQSAILVSSRSLIAAKTNLILIAKTATITRAYVLPASSTNLVLTGETSILSKGLVFVVTDGTLFLAGQNAELTYSSGASYSLIADVSVLNLSTESATFVYFPFKPIPVYKSQQVVGMGRFYTYHDLLSMNKRKLEERAPEPKEETRQPDPVLSERMLSLGSRPRKQMTFQPIDVSPIRETVMRHREVATRNATRRRREREVIEV